MGTKLSDKISNNPGRCLKQVLSYLSYQYRKIILEIRRFYDQLIFTARFPVLVKRHLYTGETTSLYLTSLYLTRYQDSGCWLCVCKGDA